MCALLLRNFSTMMLHKIYNDKNMNTNNIRLAGNSRIHYGIDMLDHISKNAAIDFYRNQTHNDLLYIFNKNYDVKSYQVPSDYKDKIKIVIYTPPIDHACGGVMVMYNLMKTIGSLNKSNIVPLIYSYDHRIYKNNFCNNFFNPFLIDDKTVVIYPETISGNPLAAKHVVRWILLDLGLEVPKDRYKQWKSTDLVYHWEPVSLKNTKQLVDIWINPKVTKYNHNKREKISYALKKMQWIPHSLHPNGLTKYHSDETISIDGMDNEETIKTLNESLAFYCYDPNSFYAIMAPLCGSITVLHPVHNMNKKQFLQSRILYHKDTNFYFDSGIAYGNSTSEIKRAFETVTNAGVEFSKLASLYKNTVEQFMCDIYDLVDGKLPTNTVYNIYHDSKYE